MDNNDKMIKPFGAVKKNIAQTPIVPTYVKPDGTKVIEIPTPNGMTVYEISTDCTVICRAYNESGKLELDYIRRRNLEIGRTYDEYGNKIYEFNFLYDKGNVLAKKTEITFEYHDNGKKSREYITVFPSDIRTEILYDENETQTTKIEYRGSVKTFYDANNKPYKREIDRGSGGIITQEIKNDD